MTTREASMTPTNEAAERTMDRRDAAIGYALLETEHLPGFARRGPAFREKLAQAGYRVEREAAEAAPSGEQAAVWHRYLHAEGVLVSDEGEECGPWHHRVFLGAPSLLQERDRLDVDEMLATGRRKTVARIRERLDEAAISMRGWQDRDYRYIPEYRVASILDEAASWIATDDGAPFDVNLQHRHYFKDGRLQDWETCPDDNHASDLHALLAVRDQLGVEGLQIIPYKPDPPSTEPAQGEER